MPSRQRRPAPDKAASELPSAPAPAPTEPLDLRQSARDFSKPAGGFLGNPIKAYRPTTIDKASFQNSVRLGDLVKNGKIYLSLSDALALALENNYDIAISRYYMDLADLDLLRARAGQLLQGSGATVNSSPRAATPSTVCRRRTGRRHGRLGGRHRRVDDHCIRRGTGSGELHGPQRHGGTLQFDRANHALQQLLYRRHQHRPTPTTSPITRALSPAPPFNSPATTGRRPTTNSTTTYSPEFDSSFNAQVTQHLLQGAGIWVNKRFVYQAINNRRITDSTFRQQILYTVNQVENIYWGLVNAYEDVQAKQRALEQSSKLLGRQPQAVGDRHPGPAGRGQRRLQPWPRTSRRSSVRRTRSTTSSRSSSRPSRAT